MKRDIELIQKLIDELDDPETTKENSVNPFDDHMDGLIERCVWFLEPKDCSIVKKPIIPQYVADWIEKFKNDDSYDLYPTLKILENNHLGREDVYNWYRKNTKLFIIALLTGGYEIEPKYYAKRKGWELIEGKLKGFEYWNYSVEDKTIEGSSKWETYSHKTIFTLDEWAKLGINEQNADFEKVCEEAEE